MNIKLILESLTSEQRKRLMCAFNDEYSQFIEYQPGRYIGVNITNLKADTQIGVWSAGRIK